MSNSRLRKEENEESTFSKVAKFIGIVGAGALALTGVAIAGYAAYKILTAEDVEKLPIKVVDSYDEGTECAICLDFLKLDDKIKVLPDCRHKYHATCINQWIRQNSTCPMCRRTV